MQENLDELANASGTTFEIPANFEEQVLVFISLASHIGDGPCPSDGLNLKYYSCKSYNHKRTGG